MKVVHIEAKQRIPEADARTLEAALASAVGRDLTAADASVLSGLPLDAAEAGLIVLAGRYPARLRVTDTGALLFRFESLSRARGAGALARLAMTLRRRVLEPLIAVLTVLLGPLLLAALAADVWALGAVAKAGGWFWVVALPCVVIGTAAAFAALMTFVVFLVLPLAGLGLVGAGVAIVVMAFYEGLAGGLVPTLVMGGFMLGIGAMVSRSGIQVWLDTVVRKPTWARALWSNAIALLAGPGRTEEDALADERRLAALIRTRQGVLSLGDLIGLFGWTPAEADSQVARILCDYGGDVMLTDEGAILYSFSAANAVSGPGVMTGSLLVSAGVDVVAPTPVKASATRFFPSGTGVGVVLLGVLGFAALGALLGPATLWPTPGQMFWTEAPEGAGVWPLQLGLWPYLIVYGALAARAPLHVARRLGEQRRLTLAPYLEVAALRPAGAPFADAELRIVAELGGDHDGTTLSFPELAVAAAAAERMRAAGPSDGHDGSPAAVGSVVF